MGRLQRRGGGFTLVELLVVMAVIALLLTIALPRYMDHIDRARENTLRQNLVVMRDAIDKYHADRGMYPETLEDLVTRKYLRAIPLDPVTQRADTWVVEAPPADAAAGAAAGGVYEVRSGAAGESRDGTPYAEW